MTYLDDFICLVKRASAQLAAQDAQAMLGRIKRTLEEKGLGSHKDQVGRELTALGVELVCAEGGVTLFPKPEKFALLLGATRYVAQRGRVRRKALQRLLGHWAWWLQLCRPMYSVLFGVYRAMFDSDDETLALCPAACAELRYLAQLAPFVKADLALPVLPVVHMVDAGPQFGAVVYARHKPVEFTAEVSPPPRSKWRTALVRKWKWKEHNNLGEARSAIWATERAARAGGRSHRCVVYSDSQVVIGAWAKGRSSSFLLNRLCRVQAALCLLYGMRVYMRYVASGENLADGPSRGLRYPGVAPETRGKADRAARARASRA